MALTLSPGYVQRNVCLLVEKHRSPISLRTELEDAPRQRRLNNRDWLCMFGGTAIVVFFILKLFVLLQHIPPALDRKGWLFIFVDGLAVVVITTPGNAALTATRLLAYATARITSEACHVVACNAVACVVTIWFNGSHTLTNDEVTASTVFPGKLISRLINSYVPPEEVTKTTGREVRGAGRAAPATVSIPDGSFVKSPRALGDESTPPPPPVWPNLVELAASASEDKKPQPLIPDDSDFTDTSYRSEGIEETRPNETAGCTTLGPSADGMDPIDLHYPKPHRMRLPALSANDKKALKVVSWSPKAISFGLRREGIVSKEEWTVVDKEAVAPKGPMSGMTLTS